MDTDLYCGGAPSAVEIGGGEHTGTTSYDWQTIEEGADRTMVHGPQGGWHIQVSPMADHIGTINFGIVVDLVLTGSLEDGTEVCYGEERVGLTADGDCRGYHPDMYCYLDVDALAKGDCDTPPELLTGLLVTIHVLVTDDDDREAEDTLTIVGVLDEDDTSKCQ